MAGFLAFAKQNFLPVFLTVDNQFCIFAITAAGTAPEFKKVTGFPFNRLSAPKSTTKITIIIMTLKK